MTSLEHLFQTSEKGFCLNHKGRAITQSFAVIKYQLHASWPQTHLSVLKPEQDYFLYFSGQGKFDVPFLEPALQYCSHLIYGYAGISDETFKLVPLNEHFDVTKDNYRAVTNLKRRYPGLRVLLSVGGNEDLNGDDDDKNLKYRTLVRHCNGGRR